MDAADAGGASSGVEAASAEASQKSGERPGGKQQQRAQSGARGAVLPGLQDLRGQWSGNLQVRLSQGFYRCSDWHMFPGLVDHKDMPDSAGNLSFVGDISKLERTSACAGVRRRGRRGQRGRQDARRGLAVGHLRPGPGLSVPFSAHQ